MHDVDNEPEDSAATPAATPGMAAFRAAGFAPPRVERPRPQPELDPRFQELDNLRLQGEQQMRDMQQKAEERDQEAIAIRENLLLR